MSNALQLLPLDAKLLPGQTGYRNEFWVHHGIFSQTDTPRKPPKVGIKPKTPQLSPFNEVNELAFSLIK